MTRKTLLGAVVLVLVTPATASAENTITRVERPTEIRSWKGIGAFSVYDEKADVYRLAITRVGSPPEILPVAPRPVAFDADVGPDTRKEPAIVYSRCTSDAPEQRDCDIYRYSITRNVESKITNADSDTASEFNPTIWDGRVAWVRTYDRRPDATPYVYTRELTAPRSRRSQRLPGVPTRRQRELGGGGGTVSTTLRRVAEIELYGRWLALNVTYTAEGLPGIYQSEVRLDTLDGQARQVARQTGGLSGQSFIGLSFDEGRLYWARFCAGDPSACKESTFGAFRYRLSTGDYALAGFLRELAGFTYVDDDRAYEVRVNETQEGACGGPGCKVVYTDPLTFRSTDPPR